MSRKCSVLKRTRHNGSAFLFWRFMKFTDTEQTVLSQLPLEVQGIFAAHPSVAENYLEAIALPVLPAGEPLSRVEFYSNAKPDPVLSIKDSVAIPGVSQAEPVEILEAIGEDGLIWLKVFEHVLLRRTDWSNLPALTAITA
jgi:hypothetical protein